MYNAELEGIDGELKLTLEAAATGMLANNLTTEQEGFALDARQGRKLNERKLDKELVDGMQVTGTTITERKRRMWATATVACSEVTRKRRYGYLTETFAAFPEKDRFLL